MENRCKKNPCCGDPHNCTELGKKVIVIDGGGRGSAKTAAITNALKYAAGEEKMGAKPGQRGIINPDFKPISSEMILAADKAKEELQAWRKEWKPRALPHFGWMNGDAYKLYKYQSEDTGLVEWVWNSRDGVVPFTMIGLDGKRATHVDFWEDVYIPNYVPAVGTRIWTDRPDFDEKKHQFNLQIVTVDHTLHNIFRTRASFTPWRPDFTERKR